MSNQQAIAPRVARRISKAESGCWEWQGCRDKMGYGKLGQSYGGSTLVHRYVYSMLVGDPGDLTLDHLCRNPPCCNPEHLEPVTRRENTRRGMVGPVTKARFIEHTHCPQGHALFGSNLYTWTSPKGYVHRQCRTCRKRHSDNRKR